MPGIEPAAYQCFSSSVLALPSPRTLQISVTNLGTPQFLQQEKRHPLQTWSGRSSFLFIQQFWFLQYIETGSLFTIHYVLHGNFSIPLKKPKFQLILTGSKDKTGKALTLHILVYCSSSECQSLSSISPMQHLLEFWSSKHSTMHFTVLITAQMLLLLDTSEFPRLKLDIKAKWWEIL